MLPAFEFQPLSATDWLVFNTLVRRDHYLRQAEKLIDFGALRKLVTKYYSPEIGRPAIEPLLMLKLMFLQYHDNLSDRQVLLKTETDVAYRMFLGLGMEAPLPHPSSLTYFRGRLGTEGFRNVFDALVGQAREHGLVKDRLRLRDATHVIADADIPTTLALLAQTRDQLLAAAEPFDAVLVFGEQARIETIRESSSADERLLLRVDHLRDILTWVDELPEPEDPQGRPWQKLQQARALAHKILDDQEHPEKGDRTRSVVDPDARRGKHGDWYDGYMLDVSMDADSQLITSIDVLPANADEAANAAKLIAREEQAHGNDVKALSIDGVAYQGQVLHELQDPEGLDLDLYVPPSPQSESTKYTAKDFQEDREAGKATCPNGEQTTTRYRNTKDTAWTYRFDRDKCQACPLRANCMDSLPKHSGRTVRKNDYAEDYRKMREKSGTEKYKEVRRQHSGIERKIADLVRNHGARRARYRCRPKVLCQQLMTAFAANVKRMVKLLGAPIVVPPAA